MASEEVTYRPAEKQDARRIAELYSIASDGISDYIWSKMAEPGDNLLDIGQQRHERKNTAFSYENCTVAEANNTVVAVLLAYEMLEDDYIEEDPVLKPFWLLEETNSFYIAGIAVDESWRQKGIARALMDQAEGRCRQSGFNKLSLIVFEANKVAHDFYLRLGYVEIMRKTIVDHPKIHSTGDALLLVKSL
jgi:ribosomal protein S18 acetylase RimI-like enzyme